MRPQFDRVLKQMSTGKLTNINDTCFGILLSVQASLGRTSLAVTGITETITSFQSVSCFYTLFSFHRNSSSLYWANWAVNAPAILGSCLHNHHHDLIFSSSKHLPFLTRSKSQPISAAQATSGGRRKCLLLHLVLTTQF